jgi:hypothetical protein
MSAMMTGYICMKEKRGMYAAVVAAANHLMQDLMRDIC